MALQCGLVAFMSESGMLTQIFTFSLMFCTCKGIVPVKTEKRLIVYSSFFICFFDFISELHVFTGVLDKKMIIYLVVIF